MYDQIDLYTVETGVLIQNVSDNFILQVKFFHAVSQASCNGLRPFESDDWQAWYHEKIVSTRRCGQEIYYPLASINIFKNVSLHYRYY